MTGIAISSGIVSKTASLASPIGVGSATATDILSLELDAGIWVITANATLHRTTTNLQQADLWLAPGSASFTNAYISTTVEPALIAGGAENISVSFSTIVTLTQFGTVYFSIEVTNTGVTVENLSVQHSIPNATTLLAFQIS